MKTFAYETIIINKSAWKFLKNYDRQRGGFKKLSDEQLNNFWNKIDIFKNRGANPATHPIKANEVRIDRDTFNMKLDMVKQVLEENGFKYRQDGFVSHGMNV